jgi:hypothetical protein
MIRPFSVACSGRWLMGRWRQSKGVKRVPWKREMTLRSVIGLRVAIGAIIVMLCLPARQGVAEDAASGGGIARPSVEELAIPRTPAEAVADTNTREAMCLMIESAARAEDLPLEFFARVIWQESRFQADAVGPVTRSGQRAQGIAQFMPGTATERRLLDPFDPVQALPKSAEFLNELRGQFGNLGLAAAAYNAGPRRVQEWLAGSGGLPQETRNYVAAVTGTTVDEWAAARRNDKMPDRAPATTCRELMALLKRAPNLFVTQLEKQVKRATIKPWGVQVAAGFDRAQALAMYARAMKGLSTIMAHQGDPNLAPILFRVRGTSNFYQARIGTDRRREADDLCRRIRRAGGSCLVKRNTT